MLNKIPLSVRLKTGLLKWYLRKTNMHCSTCGLYQKDKDDCLICHNHLLGGEKHFCTRYWGPWLSTQPNQKEGYMNDLDL